MSGDGNTNRPFPSLILLGILDFCCILIGLERIDSGKVFIGTIWIVVGVSSGLIGYYWAKLKEYFSTRYRRIIVIAIAVLVSIGFLIYRKSIAVEVPQPTPTVIPISFRMGCEIDHIPIHIPAASTVSVLRLHPAILYGNPRFQDLGVFQRVSTPSEKALDWPTKSEGRWMTKEENMKSWSSGITATPYASRCTLTSYSPQITIDDIVAYLLIDLPDTTKPKSSPPAVKRLSFPIAFDPLMSGHSFQFYIVNTCSSGVIPELVQWSNQATIRVAGEPTPRNVPLRYERLSFPSQLLMGSMGATSWIWNDLHECHWDRPN
jgi:hypothetical protein